MNKRNSSVSFRTTFSWMICSRSFLAAWKMALTLLCWAFAPVASLYWWTAEGVCCIVTLFFRIGWGDRRRKNNDKWIRWRKILNMSMLIFWVTLSMKSAYLNYLELLGKESASVKIVICCSICLNMYMLMHSVCCSLNVFRINKRQKWESVRPSPRQNVVSPLWKP